MERRAVENGQEKLKGRLWDLYRSINSMDSNTIYTTSIFQIGRFELKISSLIIFLIFLIFSLGDYLEKRHPDMSLVL